MSQGVSTGLVWLVPAGREVWGVWPVPGYVRPLDDVWPLLAECVWPMSITHRLDHTNPKCSLAQTGGHSRRVEEQREQTSYTKISVAFPHSWTARYILTKYNWAGGPPRRRPIPNCSLPFGSGWRSSSSAAFFCGPWPRTTPTCWCIDHRKWFSRTNAGRQRQPSSAKPTTMRGRKQVSGESARIALSGEQAGRDSPKTSV